MTCHRIYLYFCDTSTRCSLLAMETNWLRPDEERAWRAFRRLLTVLPARIGRDLAADSGLSSADYEVLSTLSEKPGRRWELKGLAQKMEWSRSRLSHHASRMQHRGLIARDPDPQDARGCLLRVTDQGLAVLTEAAQLHLISVRSRFIDHLSPAELTMLERISDRIAGLPE